MVDPDLTPGPVNARPSGSQAVLEQKGSRPLKTTLMGRGATPKPVRRPRSHHWRTQPLWAAIRPGRLAGCGGGVPLGGKYRPPATDQGAHHPASQPRFSQTCPPPPLCVRPRGPGRGTSSAHCFASALRSSSRSCRSAVSPSAVLAGRARGASSSSPVPSSSPMSPAEPGSACTSSWGG